MAQKRTSKDTSINTINKVYKDLVKKGATDSYIPFIFDYGCGKYDSNKEFATSNGFAWAGYDPYNRTETENYSAMTMASMITPDIIVCNNVLNVIDDDDAVEDVVRDIEKLKGNYTDVYFTIYEGDKSGIGKETSKGYQRNEKTEKYMELLKNFFFEVKKHGNIIECY